MGHDAFGMFARLTARLRCIWLQFSMAAVLCAAGLASPVMADMQVGRCVNIGNALDAPFEGAWGPSITVQDLDWIAGAGFDAIRLPVRFGSHWNGTIWPGFLARVEQVVVQAQERGLTVILDLHHFDDLMADPETFAPVFVAIWSELADRFEGHDDRLIFELLNEPRDAVTTARAVELYQSVLPIIRRKHPDRWIILGGGNMYSLDEMLTLPDLGPRIALTFHYYNPVRFTHQQSQWTDEYFPPAGWGLPTEIATITADIARAARSDVPVFLGEFGVVREADTASRNAWIETVRMAAEEHGIGWCYWAYGAGFDVRDFSGYEWYPGLHRALME
jgi:endoglucanase